MTMDHHRWLAEIGYATYERMLRLLGIGEAPAFADLDAAHQLAEIARTTAIRRRVVAWGLSAEQDDIVPASEPSTLDAARSQHAAGDDAMDDPRPCRHCGEPEGTHLLAALHPRRCIGNPWTSAGYFYEPATDRPEL